MPRPAAEAGATQLTAALAALIGTRATDSDRFGVAVSGGPDSMALLLLAHQALPGRIAAATFDHGLRADSAAEAAMVADQCRAWGIAHSTLHPPVPITGSVQDAARTARYAALERWRADTSLDWVMTAHHADDQLETMLMRLNRGSGVGGMAAIRAVQGRIVRPLLHHRRAQLVAFAARHGVPTADDPSNRDLRFDRVQMRGALHSVDWLDPLAAAQSADALAAAQQALDWTTRHLADMRVTRGAAGIDIDLSDLPAELVRRLLTHALALAEPDRPAPRGDALSRALAALRSGAATMLGNTVLTSISDDLARVALRPAATRRGTSGGE